MLGLGTHSPPYWPSPAMTLSNPEIEQLAAAIGSEVYMDVARWHLYLRDAKLHTELAEKVAPLVVDKTIDEKRVTHLLQQMPIKLGGGRTQVPLSDLLPIQSILNLLDVLEKFADQR
ncbi:MAG: DUF3181 family protein [Cyanophyceae cyanobacterium]